MHPHTPLTKTPQEIPSAVIQWFERVVLGLNLCPFAHRPAREQLIIWRVSKAKDEAALMDEFVDAVTELIQNKRNEKETTLLIVPSLLADFYDYQFFLAEANRKLKALRWQDDFQLASFHPDYCFAGQSSDDAENLTNRSPSPIIHILRQESLNAVLKEGDTSEDIVKRNMETMRNLSDDEKQALFTE